MKKLIIVILKYQVISFFSLTLFITFCISIPCLILLDFNHPISDIIQFCFVQLMLFSPVLSGIIISTLTNKDKQKSNKKTRWIVFLTTWIVAFIISWQTRFHYDNFVVEITNACIRAMIPGFIISFIFSSNIKLSDYLSTILRPRGKIIWYLIALLTFPVIHIIGNSVIWLIDGTTNQSSNTEVSEVIFKTIITFFSVLLFSGGLNEEAGWRGFALPRLQSRYCPLIAGIIIWVFHVIWELPGDIIFTGSAWPVISRLIWMPSWSILFIWVFNRTTGSILAPIIFHASMNSMNTLSVLLPPTYIGTIILVGFAFYAIIYDKMWKKLPNDHLAVY